MIYASLIFTAKCCVLVGMPFHQGPLQSQHRSMRLVTRVTRSIRLATPVRQLGRARVIRHDPNISEQNDSASSASYRFLDAVSNLPQTAFLSIVSWCSSFLICMALLLPQHQHLLLGSGIDVLTGHFGVGRSIGSRFWRGQVNKTDSKI